MTVDPISATSSAGESRRPASALSSARAVRRTRIHGRLLSALFANVMVLVVAALFIVPLLWVILAAFNSQAGLSVEIPGRWTLDNFRAVLTPETTYRPIANGIVLCGGAALLTIVCATFAGYALSRFNTRYKRPFLLTILFSTGLPITAIMVPVYGLFVQLNLIDTITGTLLFMATTGLPFAIWLMKHFIDGVPISLEEAAWTDGASRVQTLRHIILPLMWPGMSVVAIFTFVVMWGNFFVPFVLLLSPDRLPASVSIYTFFSQYGEVQFGQLAAYSLLYSFPVVALFLLLSRKLGGAFTLGGAVKG
jgi:multiple sugar transport system permease protein